MTARGVAVPTGGRLAKWFASYRSALAQRDLRLLLGGLLISTTGSWAYNVALLAFVYDRTHSLAWVGVGGFVRLVVALVCSPFGGVLADRIDRVRLMVGSDLACAVWQVGAATVASQRGPVIVVLVLAGLTSATSVVYPPAVAATIPTVVREPDLVAANALNGSIDNLVVIAGPAIGAVLLLISSPASVFAANAATFLIAAALVSRIQARGRSADAANGNAAGPLRQVIGGIRAIGSSKAARTLVAFSALVSFVYGTDTVLFIAVSTHKLGTGSEGFGYLLAGLGVGGILMAAAVDRLGRSPRLAPIILAGALGYCLPTALLTVIHSPVVAFSVQVARGGATLIVDVLAITALQRAVPDERLGRVFGIFFAFVLGSIALGALVTPAATDALGLNGALVTMALAPAALALLGFPALLRIDRESSARAAALAPRVALLKELDIFATASRSVLERLAGLATEMNYVPGTVIVAEGDAADTLYVLAAGQVQVTSRGERGGPERPIRTMNAPSYFGEIGVLQHIPRTATVTALTDCRCERIPGEVLLEVLDTTPASSSLMENVRARAAITHPSLSLSFAQDNS